ncbi:Smr/MutS family protein [Pseudoxanthobacter sp.]|uniref:Smr/MutS family protein n=1 Tax=Pseudoxanthobacter sp. TaxID=1925742 RepID=UPI002FE180FC
MSARRRKGLSDEDRALWALLAATVEPLPLRRARMARRAKAAGEAGGPDAAADAAAALPPAAAPPAAKAGAAAAPARPVPPPQPPVLPLERRVMRELKSGRREIEDRIDLHGFTQEAAHMRLMAFLVRAQISGYRTVLIITGKGARDGERGPLHEPERGVLRRMVPHWLEMPSARHIVSGYSQASLAHGGAGALYVRIRRVRG